MGMFYQRTLTNDELMKRVPSIFSESQKDSLSDRYLKIPTYKILEKLQSHDFRIVGAKQSSTRTSALEHAKHVLFLTHSSISETALSRGQELPMIRIDNSHNGLSSFQISTGFFRLVCSNGLIMPKSELNSFSIRHTIGMEQDVISASFKVLTELPNQVRQVEALKSISLNSDEKRLFAESAANLIFDAETLELNAKNGRDLPGLITRIRRHEDQSSDLWTTFNVIQENAIKGGLRIYSQNEQGQRSLRKTREVKAIDSDKKINIELMLLAQKMAELKGVKLTA